MLGSIVYLAALFVFQICWTGLCYLEKMQPSMYSKIGANVFFVLLLVSVVFAFFVIEWWIVLISLPIIWFCGGRLGGKIASRWNFPIVYILVCVFSMSVMYHTYILLNK